MQGAVGVSENLLLGEGRIEKFLVSKVAQSCPTLCDPVDCSLPGSSVHAIFQQEHWSGVTLPSPDSN